MSTLEAVQWATFVIAKPEANFLQSVEWGKVHELLGDTVLREGVWDGGRIVGGWQGIVKDARRGRYLEVPGAPLIDWSDSTMINEVVRQLRASAKKYGCVFVRVRPQLADSKAYRQQFASLGFRQAPMHLHAEHTNILDLTKPEAELLAGMRRQTRYEVRRADKQGIVVSWRSDIKAIKEFVAMQAGTAKRQGFVPPSGRFLEAELAAFGDKLRIYRAEKGGQVLNLAVVIMYGQEAEYHEAASTPASRGLAGAYALQWRAIRDAKAGGLTRYNFWGIAYTDNPKHRYAGVTTFKRGFGGDDVAYVPAHDLIVQPGRYLKNWLIETARRKKRGL